MNKRKMTLILKFWLMVICLILCASQLVFAQNKQSKPIKKTVRKIGKKPIIITTDEYFNPVTRIGFRWFTFTSRDEKFTFELPTKELYVKENTIQTTDDGKKIELEQFGLRLLQSR